jgi:hypothetical protein
MAKTPPDWTRTGTIVAYAEWLREKSGALAVVVVRRDDAALAADVDLRPDDAKDLVIERVIDLARDLEAARKEKRKAARLELGPLYE